MTYRWKLELILCPEAKWRYAAQLISEKVSILPQVEDIGDKGRYHMESIHQKMKMYRKDMEDLGMIIVDLIFCVALLKCSNTDESTRMNIESVRTTLETIQWILQYWKT